MCQRSPLRVCKRWKTYADDVAAAQGLLAFTLLEELALSVGRDKASTLVLRGLGARNRGDGRRLGRGLGDNVVRRRLLVSADETLPSLTNDVSFAAAASEKRQ